MPKKYTGTMEDYLWDRCIPEPNSGCWLWLQGAGSHGYGQVKLQGRYLLTHRLAWSAKHGRRVPRGKQVLHKCDVRACVNPDHLFVGTHLENHRDKVRKGRQARGERNGAARHTEETIAAILRAKGTQQEIGDRYGITRSHVSMIKNRKAWKHLSVPAHLPPPRESEK